MRISFDLDDTLICRQAGVPREPALSWFYRMLGGGEPLRRGAVALMRQLQLDGWDVWIYTTSLRKPAAVRRWLRCHGVRVAGVINQDIHLARMSRSPVASPPSKNPAAFGIDLHIDDSQGVGLEGQRHGFKVLVLALDDTAWVERVLEAAREVKA